MAVQDVDEFGDLLKLVKEKHLVVIDFWATWCGPCKTLSPVFAKFAEKITKDRTDIAFIKIDVDKMEEAEVTSLPTFRIYKDSKLKDELKGEKILGAKLEEWIALNIKE